MGKKVLNRALRIMLVTNSLVLLAGAMLGPIYAIYVERVGGDLLDASLAGGIFALVAGLTVLLAGNLSDRIKENEMVVAVGYLMIGLGFLLYLWVESVFMVFLIQIIIGLGEAIYSPAFDAVYSKHLDVGKSGLQWGWWEAMNYFTYAVGAVIGGLVVVNLGFDFVFVVMAVLCFGSALYIYLLPRKVLQEKYDIFFFIDFGGSDNLVFWGGFFDKRLS